MVNDTSQQVRIGHGLCSTILDLHVHTCVWCVQHVLLGTYEELLIHSYVYVHMLHTLEYLTLTTSTTTPQHTTHQGMQLNTGLTTTLSQLNPGIYQVNCCVSKILAAYNFPRVLQVSSTSPTRRDVVKCIPVKRIPSPL